MYFCKAEVKQYEDDYYEEDMETSVTSNNINVVIFPELYIISKPLPNAFKNEGESFTFDIKTNGYPTPEYEWTHGNKIIGRNKKIIVCCNIKIILKIIFILYFRKSNVLLTIPGSIVVEFGTHLRK